MINQFSANYDPSEDRILLRFNTKDSKEFRFWLTRRSTDMLLDVLPRKTEQGEQIQEDLQKQIEKKQLMDNLDKNYNFDLPEGVLQDDFNEIWHRIQLSKKDDTLDADDKSLSDNQLKSRYKKISHRRVKLGVLLQHIAKEEKIAVSEDDLSKGIMQYASQYPGQEKQILDYLKQNPSYVESIKAPILEQKVIDSIRSKIKIKKVKLTEDQFKKLEEEVFDIKKEKKNEKSN